MKLRTTVFSWVLVLVLVAFGVVIATLALVFMLTDNTFGVFFLLPVSILSWFVFIRPTHRRRYSEAIQHLPRWDLRAEP